MRIALISGSRSDRNALVMVRDMLGSAHEKRWIELGPEGMVGPSRWALPEKPWHPVVAAEKALFWTGLNVNGFGEDHVGHADLAILHGDRHEVLAAAVACNVMGIPIAHIGGGDITEGSQDDCFRHAITKLSHLHFASCQDSADRIIQMGEEPDRVHVTGCPGIDMVMATETLGWFETFEAVGMWRMETPHIQPAVKPGAKPFRSLLVLFHPNTLGDTAAELKALSEALMSRREALVLLGPNADAGSDLIRREWQSHARERPDTIYHENVEPQLFYSLLKHCDVLVGNSSAGYYEASYFGTKVLDLGDRQCGRTRPFNVRQESHWNAGVISSHIDVAMSKEPWVGGLVDHPYGDGHAAERIAKVIGGIKDPRALLRKRFHEVWNPDKDAWPERRTV